MSLSLGLSVAMKLRDVGCRVQHCYELEIRSKTFDFWTILGGVVQGLRTIN